MADRYWRGTNSTWSDTANWSTTPTGATGSAAPVSTNDVYILDGDGDIDAYDASAVDLNSLTIGGKFRGKIKGLKVAVSGTTIINCVNDVNIGAGTNNIDDLRVYSTGGATVRLFSGGGLVTACQLASGTLVRESGCTITTMHNAGGTLIDSGGTAYTTLNAKGGTTITQIGATTLNATARVIATGASAFTTANIDRGATFTHNAYGTIATITVFPGGIATTAPAGTISAGGTEVTGASQPFIVTNSTEWLGGSLFRDANASITYTNATTRIGKTGA